MKHFTAMAATLALFLGTAAQARAAILYATSQASGNPSIWLVDTTANTSSLLYHLAQNPDSLVFTPDGNILYTALNVGQVRLFNTKTHADTLVASGLNTPLDLTLDPGGKSVLVSSFGNGFIDRIDLTTHTIAARDFGGNPEGITYDDSGRLFAKLGTRTHGDAIIAQLDPANGNIIHEHTGLTSLDGLTFDSFTGKLYATNEANNVIDVIDPTTLAVTVLPNSSIPTPDGIEADGLGNLYIAAFGANVYTYNLITGTLTKGPAVPVMDDLAPVAGLGANPAPEPASLTLFGIGMAGLFGYRYRRRLQTVGEK
jgi:DNA-binding beta-propeller fold protein YncE